jgi:hypothetical protein
VKEMLTSDTPRLAFSNIPHELGLQFLSTELTAYVQGSLAGRDVFIPRTQVQYGAVKLAE